MWKPWGRLRKFFVAVLEKLNFISPPFSCLSILLTVSDKEFWILFLKLLNQSKRVVIVNCSFFYQSHITNYSWKFIRNLFSDLVNSSPRKNQISLGIVKVLDLHSWRHTPGRRNGGGGGRALSFSHPSFARNRSKTFSVINRAVERSENPEVPVLKFKFSKKATSSPRVFRPSYGPA